MQAQHSQGRHMMDAVGNTEAKAEIQIHGSGVSDDFPLAYLWASSHTLRLADSLDEIHKIVVAKPSWS